MAAISMLGISMLDQMTRDAEAERIEKAADYIEAHGLWQGSYYQGGFDPAEYVPGEPVCAAGALQVVCARKWAENLQVDYGLAKRLHNLIEAELGPECSLIKFSDDDRKSGQPARLAPPEHQAQVVELFRRTAAHLRSAD